MTTMNKNGIHNIIAYNGAWLAVCQHCGERGRIAINGHDVSRREAAHLLRAWGWRFGKQATCPKCAERKGGDA